MIYDKVVRRECPDPELVGVNTWRIKGRAFAFDKRARSDIVLSYGYRADHNIRAVSLRIDDRLVVLGATGITQLVILLLRANALNVRTRRRAKVRGAKQTATR